LLSVTQQQKASATVDRVRLRLVDGRLTVRKEFTCRCERRCGRKRVAELVGVNGWTCVTGVVGADGMLLDVVGVAVRWKHGWLLRLMYGGGHCWLKLWLWRL
jgi:hypothetical protein